MSQTEFSFRTKNQSCIEGELELTREEVRAIKKLTESKMTEYQYDDDREDGCNIYKLGGSNWADLGEVRMKCKMWLVENQR